MKIAKAQTAKTAAADGDNLAEEEYGSVKVPPAGTARLGGARTVTPVGGAGETVVAFPAPAPGAAAATVMASFIPPPQWPGTPQM